MDIRIVEGEIGIVVAHAIDPDFEMAIPDGNPKIVRTFHSLTTQLFTDISEQLGLAGFTIQPASSAPAQATIFPIGGSTDTPMVAKWTVALPAQTIWNQVPPVFLSIIRAIALELGVIALLYGRAFRSSAASEAENRFLAQHDVCKLVCILVN